MWDCSRGFHESSQYNAKSERVAVIAGVASDTCGAGGRAACGLEKNCLSSEVLILNMDMHENRYLSTAPAPFFCLELQTRRRCRRC